MPIASMHDNHNYSSGRRQGSRAQALSQQRLGLHSNPLRCVKSWALRAQRTMLRCRQDAQRLQTSHGGVAWQCHLGQDACSPALHEQELTLCGQYSRLGPLLSQERGSRLPI